MSTSVRCLALGGELDDVSVDDLPDGDPARHLGAPGFERGVASERIPDRLGELSVGDLDAAHAGSLDLGIDECFEPVARGQRDDLAARLAELGRELVPCGIGHVTHRIGGLRHTW